MPAGSWSWVRGCYAVLVLLSLAVGLATFGQTTQAPVQETPVPQTPVPQAPVPQTPVPITAAQEPPEASPHPFRDITAETGLDFVHFNGMSGRFYFAEVVGSGGALFDYDGDGDLDLYLVQGRFLGAEDKVGEALISPRPPLPPRDRLYRNDLIVLPDGSRRLRFSDVTAASGIHGVGYGMGVATGDVDNDGDVDLYVSHFGPDRLWLNQGDGTFRDGTAAAGLTNAKWSVPATFFDYDGDGWLDLYVGLYLDYSLARNRSCVGETGLKDYCGPQTYAPEPDLLYRNLGKGRFENVSRAAGLAAEAGGALGVLAADLNGDGRQDLYVANDQTPNQLWLNQGDGTFFNDALLLGCAVNRDGDAEASMGVDAADFDFDGDLDLFMTHLTRESNTLYVNDGKGLFHDRSTQSGLATPSWGSTGFGTSFLDYDNDGQLDIFTANGSVFVIFEQRREEDPYPLRQKNQLFRGLGEGKFVDISATSGPVFAREEVSRGAIFGDLDNDGDRDIVLTNSAGPARILLNAVGQDHSWLGLRLLTGKPGRDALGALAGLHRQGAPTLWRRVRTDGSYASANDPRILFGLGETATGKTPIKLEIHWPDGKVEHWHDLEPGRIHRLRQGEGRPPA